MMNSIGGGGLSLLGTKQGGEHYPIFVKKNHNSLYASISFVLFDRYKYCTNIRNDVWNQFSSIAFGVNLKALIKLIEENKVIPPIRPEACTGYTPVHEWIRSVSPNNNANYSRLNRILAIYVSKQSIEGQADPRIVCPLICDVYGYSICLMQHAAAPNSGGGDGGAGPDEYNCVAKFSPSELCQKNKHSDSYIHLLWDEPFYSVLMSETIPTRVLKTFLWDGQHHHNRRRGHSSTGMDDDIYVLRVFDPHSKRNIAIGPMEPPNSHTCRVHHIGLSDFIRAGWQYSVLPHKDSKDSLYFFVTKKPSGRVAYFISYWEPDYVSPVFFLRPDDDVLFLVEAISIDDAIYALEVEQRIIGRPYPDDQEDATNLPLVKVPKLIGSMF